MAGNTKIKIWVNGTFDVLHRGHIELIKYASKFGTLRVGIDFDERVKSLKGNDRPMNPWRDRKFMMESITYVDSVVGFGSDAQSLVDSTKSMVLAIKSFDIGCTL